MKKLFYLTAYCLLLTAYPVLAQWSSNPAINTAICTATGNQFWQQIISDGSGGAIITWQDFRSGSPNDIYAQRINASGAVQWTANGVIVCSVGGTQTTGTFPQLISDGSGGAIITWTRYDLPGVYVQRINASGVVQWTANGVAVSTVISSQFFPQLISDGGGGAIIIWRDSRNGNNDIYAQHIRDGYRQWAGGGVAICTATGSQDYPQIVSAGGSAAMITWEDSRSGNQDIYAQGINGDGTMMWTANGVAVCTATGNQYNPELIYDGQTAGYIITWFDNRSGNQDIYAQHIYAIGVGQWIANGVAVCTATANQELPQLISDGSGGAIITWQDNRIGNGYDIYTQRINASGTGQWTANGVAVCTGTGVQDYPQLISDGGGGAIITWQDIRSGNKDIYAQRINASGAGQWTASGVAISTATGDQLFPQLISDGSGGAIITWRDSYFNNNANIYAQNVCALGTLGPCLVTSIPEHSSTDMHSWIEMGQLNVLLNGETPGIAEGQKLTLNLFDISGRLLQTNTDVIKQSSTYKMDISGLAQGMYVVSLQTENTIYSNKIVVSR